MTPASRALLAAVTADLAACGGISADGVARRIGHPDRRVVYSLLEHAAVNRGCWWTQTTRGGPRLWHLGSCCPYCGGQFTPAGPAAEEHPVPLCDPLRLLAAETRLQTCVPVLLRRGRVRAR